MPSRLHVTGAVLAGTKPEMHAYVQRVPPREQESPVTYALVGSGGHCLNDSVAMSEKDCAAPEPPKRNSRLTGARLLSVRNTPGTPLGATTREA